MARTMGRRGGIIEGINVTPLVDITLVLLIIFIVTAKMVVTPALSLDLPSATQSDTLQTVLAVAMPPDGTIQVDGVVVSEDGLQAKAREALARDPELRAVIQADKVVSHGRVMTVLDLLKGAGLARVAFGTQGEAPRATE